MLAFPTHPGCEYELEDIYPIYPLQETLRLHPILPTISRTAEEDDIVPLAVPIVTSDRQTTKELRVSKGQDFSISICGYNRLRSVWGDDAETWNPQRFLEMSKEKQTTVGVYANLCVPFPLETLPR